MDIICKSYTVWKLSIPLSSVIVLMLLMLRVHFTQPSLLALLMSLVCLCLILLLNYLASACDNSQATSITKMVFPVVYCI